MRKDLAQFSLYYHHRLIKLNVNTKLFEKKKKNSVYLNAGIKKDHGNDIMGQSSLGWI